MTLSEDEFLRQVLAREGEEGEEGATSVQQAPAPEAQPEPPAPWEVFLFTDAQRRESINNRFHLQTIGSLREIDPKTLDQLVFLEKALERRLLQEGYPPHKLEEKWGHIRGFAFPSRKGEPLSKSSVQKDFFCVTKKGIEKKVWLTTAS